MAIMAYEQLIRVGSISMSSSMSSLLHYRSFYECLIIVAIVTEHFDKCLQLWVSTHASSTLCYLSEGRYFTEILQRIYFKPTLESSLSLAEPSIVPAHYFILDNFYLHYRSCR